MGIFTAAVALFSNGGVGQLERKPRGARSDDDAETKGTVLVIDDDPTFLEAIRLLLCDAGYNVLASSTGPKGLDMVRYAPKNIRLVLLDYNMPRFNGAETLEFLRKLNPNLKVVAVSGFRVTDLPETFHRGVERLLSKPFSNDQLLKTVEEVLEGNSANEAAVSASN
jgi:two-component system, cell cycle sensor histidine kinase and response regulator CckA